MTTTADTPATEATNIRPATTTVHWPGQPVNVCDEHAINLVGLAEVMGFTCSTTPFAGREPCINCVNAAKRRSGESR